MTADADAPPVAVERQPRWLTVSTLVLSLIGLAASVYLTVSHYTDTALVCTTTGVVDCGAVTNSPQSRVFGIPVAVLGLVFFLVLVPLMTPIAWRSPLPAVRWLRLGAVVTGLLFVAYLVTAELAVIGRICEWCTSVHVVVLALFALVVTSEMRARPV
ncbi:MAG: vitamin K epoxide reductase family protein [Kutzneria sp.]|nr:vitamin K epoxide reductase family protein [Kutzneria sp.]